MAGRDDIDPTRQINDKIRAIPDVHIIRPIRLTRQGRTNSKRQTPPKPVNTLDVTVFYAWESDRPRNVTFDLIGKAAEAAAQRITEDHTNSWAVKLDRDTRGVAGMCDIPATILAKIAKADIFLGDLTIVGKTDELNDKGEPKLLPNANVLFELGYAAHALGFEVLVGVMNEAFGTIDGQVFDIKKRGSLKYSLPADATQSARRATRDALSKDLESVFRETIQTIVEDRRKTILISTGSVEATKYRAIHFTITNPRSVDLPPHRLALFHPKKGSSFDFSTQDSGPLMQHQTRVHLTKYVISGKHRGLLDWLLLNEPRGWTEADNDDFVFRVVLEKSEKVLYENRSMGVALVKLLRKLAQGGRANGGDWNALRNYPNPEYDPANDDKVIEVSGGNLCR